MNTVYFSLGTNLGNKRRNLKMALELLTECGIVVTDFSAIYETEPVTNIKQDYFLNMCVKAQTTHNPYKILKAIKIIETQMGRSKRRNKRFMYEKPRIIDIDILLFFDEKKPIIIHRHNLHIPHKHMLKRRFVLQPLTDVAAQIVHPEAKSTIANLLNTCSDHSIVIKR